MAYICKDCSYRGKTSGPDGACPACGSFTFGREQREDNKPPPKWRLQLLVALWSWLIVMIAWKLFQ